MLNTSENDQTRLLWSSHDWHVQPDCQRSTPDTTKVGRFGSRLNTARSGASSNLLRCVAASVSVLLDIAQAALGELSESIEDSSGCQQVFSRSFELFLVDAHHHVARPLLDQIRGSRHPICTAQRHYLRLSNGAGSVSLKGHGFSRAIDLATRRGFSP
jgi:hypothetical protein